MTPPLFSRRHISTALCGLATAPWLAAHAQTGAGFPRADTPVRLTVPFAAGGGTDAMARAVSLPLQQAFGVPVVIDNRPGAGGIVGTDLVAKGSKDGHQALVTITSLIQAPSIFAKVPFDPIKDFIPVALLARVPLLLAVPGNSPHHTVDALVQAIKRDPKALTLGNYGNGTLSHILGAMFDQQAKLKLPMVAYKGAAPLAADLAAGHVHAGFIDMSSLPLEKAGKLRYIAVAGPKRLPSHPDLPTMTELGYKDFHMLGFAGLFLPAGTAPTTVAAWDKAAQAAMQTPVFKAQLDGLQYLPGGLSQAQFKTMIEQDAKTWTQLIKAVGITPA